MTKKKVKADTVQLKPPTDEPFATPANEVVHKHIGPGPDRTVSRRTGYFIAQMGFFREAIEDLEDRIGSVTTKSPEQNIEDEKKIIRRMTEDYDELEKKYTKALDLLHAQNTDCPDFDDDSCDVCYERHNKEEAVIEEVP